VGAILRERRISTGLTQQQLATASGISLGALRDLEQGRTRCPQWATISAIAAALGMDREHHADLVAAWEGGPSGDGSQPAAPKTPEVRVTVLGSLTVVCSGTAIALGSARQRTVLGLLALHWPAAVPCDVIVDVLWGGGPPRSAVAQVQAYVSRLRRLLGPGQAPGRDSGPVVLAGHSYRLDVGIALDLAEFDQLARCGDAAAAQGEGHRASALYERALGLWQDDMLADTELLHGYPAVIEATRRRGEVVLRFARGAVGTWQERTLPHLRALCASEPFNEQAHAQLMVTLAATGQQAAAVELFGQVRRRLDRELGVLPGEQLTAAHLRVLRQQVGTATDSRSSWTR
jgi:DNA-binding SARP family transcriptional activator/DNA-binding XRE family transcriptional regulator